jgi:1,4-dihydroxy-2-naphthoate octaprenyltransferase
MATWPAWGRWTAALLTYALLIAGFGLMIQDSLWLRLLGLLVFAASLPLVVHTGRALARERSRAVDRRYVREFVPAMVAYSVLMLFIWPLQKGMPAGWLKTVLVLSPMLPIAWAILASIRQVLASDELERRQHLEALAIGVAIVSVVSLALGLLCAAKVIALDSTPVLLMVYPAICITYGSTRCFLVWRTRGE